MGISDVIIAVVILTAAAYLLYYSKWKKKGHCHGGCGGKKNSLKGTRQDNPQLTDSNL